MITMVARIKVEIILDAPLVRVAVEILKRTEVSGYTLFPASSGAGRGGAWSDDPVTFADSKVMLLTVVPQEKADAIVEDLRPMLDTHGIIIMTSAVQVVRSERF